jgi:magnesium chelatase subunit H
MNFVRKHALAYQAEHGCDLETAALRVFGNADGAYGANVNQLVDKRPLGRRGRARRDLHAPQGLRLRPRTGKPGSRTRCCSVLADVELAYQNLDSVELGVTTSTTTSTRSAASAARCARAKRGARRRSTSATRRAARARCARWPSRSRSRPAPACSTRSGTRACCARLRGRAPDRGHVTNTMGWSATTGQVAALGLPAADQTFVLDPRCASASRSSTRPRPRRSRTA